MREPQPFPHLDTYPEVREGVRAGCAKYPAQYWDEHDRDHVYAADFVRDFAAAGFSGILIPEEYGGGGGTVGDFCAALEEVAASGGGMNAASSVHVPLLFLPTLIAFRCGQQPREYLPKI